MKSIRQYLLVGMFSALILAFVVSFVISYRATTEEVKELYDAQLIQDARFVEGFLNQATHKLDWKHINRALANAAKVSFAEGVESSPEGHAYEHKMAIQVWDLHGNLLLSTPSAPKHALSPLKKGFFRKREKGYDWYIYTHQIPTNHYWLITAERSDVREEMIEKIVVSLLTGNLMAIFMIGILVSFIIKRGLAPLRSLSNAISLRDLDYLKPVKLPEQVPNELSPVIKALNHLFDRLDDGIERERRFLADAAHELRTPMAVLKLQLQVTQQYTDPTQIHQAIDKALLGVDRSTHVVEQLLTLARLEPDKHLLERTTVDLVKLAQETIGLQVPLALAHQQQLSLTYDEQTEIHCLGNKVLLGVLLRNLIDNALRYTPEGGHVEVTVKQQEKGILLAVYDTGCGVPEQDIPRLMQRFYRHEQSADTQGTGLGLSIVQRIAELHEAKIEIYNRDGGGLAVEVWLSSV
ncbi:hypothetical protein FK216_13040 [Moraxellaceae bacterium AER2_44_116]|nr:sensor histidine kinase N-terminal domain-containing protein [Moraxellaceae bacterium]TQC95991.1 hypothetical protein FK216_13040 [Moraxellaceae bacterium AER2_44_116]